MIFLIEYDRASGRLLRKSTFSDGDRVHAEDSRLELELRLNANAVSHEVVLLQADSEDALRKTHNRYFASLTELLTLPGR